MNADQNQLVRRNLFQPHFIAVVAVLLLAGVGFRVAVGHLKLIFRKQPVPLRMELSQLPRVLGPWVMVGNDAPLEEDIEHVLGTKEYVFREYLDSRRVTPLEIERLNNLPLNDRKRELMRMQVEDPRRVVNLAVTYYTGLVDTVAHVPDRCYVADGYQPKSFKPEVWINDPTVEVRFINFEDQTQRSKVPKSVAYFFHANGSFISDPYMVRQRLQNLLETHGYYAKVETMTLSGDQALSRAVMTDLLTHALPAVLRCLPDWEQVTRDGTGETAPVAVSAD